MKFFVDNLYLIVIALVSGGLLAWPLFKRGGGSTNVTPAEATALINQHNAIVVDVRDDKAFALGSVTGARNIPSASVAERIADLVRFKSRPVIVVCESGQQSAKAVAAIKAAGFEDVRVLTGGLNAWKQAGLPLVQATRDAKVAAKEPGKARPKGDRNRNANKAPARLPQPAAVATNDSEIAPVAVVEPEAVAPVEVGAAPTPDRVKEAT